MRAILLPILLLLSSASTDSPARPVGEASIRAEDLQTDIAFLADDARQGRWLESRGLTETEEYIARRFTELGLTPLPGEASLFVDFTLYGRYYDEARTFLEPELPAGPGAETGDRPVLGVDFRPFDFSALGELEGELVFAGYGITAPELGWDDYEGLDVENKLVLVLRHHPLETDPGGPFGRAGSEHALFLAKADNAQAHGARGMLLVTDPLHHRADDDLRLQAGLALTPNRARISRNAGPPRQSSFLSFQISQPLAAKLVSSRGHSLEALQRAVDDGRHPNDVSLAGARVRAGVALEPAAKPVAGRNVIGVLPGSDPRLRDEWILVGGHHDHVGAYRGAGDTIFNGADDNASGTAGVLALARAFATAETRPPRSLVFATFSAEERGLLGSRALIESDRLPLERIGLMLNLDMIGRNPDRPVEVLGDGYAYGLRAAVQTANGAASPADRLALDFAGTRYAGNSDHGPFFDEGVPFLFFFTGLHSDYHQVSDHADKIAYDHTARLVRLVYRTVDRLASADRLPPFLHEISWLGASAVSTPAGVELVRVEPDSRAFTQGLRTGTQLVPAEGSSEDPAHVIKRLIEARPGFRVRVQAVTEGDTTPLTLVRPAAGYLGVMIRRVDPEQLEASGLAQDEGVLITEVTPGGPAEMAGLRGGDVLIRLGGRRIGPSTLISSLEEIGAYETVSITVLREGERVLRTITLGERP